ncbi:Spo0E family sporulation regulatory protein-aspartic acid phosphatase [Bacillus massilioanorexius]
MNDKNVLKISKELDYLLNKHLKLTKKRSKSFY